MKVIIAILIAGIGNFFHQYYFEPIPNYMYALTITYYQIVIVVILTLIGAIKTK